jgi:hypothetical protein
VAARLPRRLEHVLPVRPDAAVAAPTESLYVPGGPEEPDLVLRDDGRRSPPDGYGVRPPQLAKGATLRQTFRSGPSPTVPPLAVQHATRVLPERSLRWPAPSGRGGR